MGQDQKERELKGKQHCCPAQRGVVNEGDPTGGLTERIKTFYKLDALESFPFDQTWYVATSAGWSS